MSAVFAIRRCLRHAAAAGVALLTAATLAPGQTAPAPADYRRVRDYILDAVAKGRSPAVSVAVVKDDRVVWAEGFGLADRERKIPATADTIYSLASVSKPLTATGLMVLVERGLIDLDAPANRYLPGDAAADRHPDPPLDRRGRHRGGELQRPAADEADRRDNHRHRLQRHRQGHPVRPAGPSAIPDLNFTLTRRDNRLTGVCSAFLQSFFTLPHFVTVERDTPRQ